MKIRTNQAIRVPNENGYHEYPAGEYSVEVKIGYVIDTEIYFDLDFKEQTGNSTDFSMKDVDRVIPGYFLNGKRLSFDQFEIV